MTNGLKIHTGYLELEEQRQLLAEIDRGLAEAPLYTAVMPKTGKPLSVQMSNFGSLGWVSDRSGYRYQPLHPETGRPWPAIPEAILAIWRKLADYPHEPEACLVNYYGESARMGLHRDADEEDFAAPVVSISLGDKALFRIGGLSRSDPTRSITLSSGDVVVMGGASRLCYHGIDRILPGTSRLISEGGRINLTLRRVTRP